jgi:hypothetical protein
MLKDQERSLREAETRTYVMLRDVTAGKKSLRKDEEVKIVIVSTDDSLKVYGYSAAVDRLKAERVLLLYIFSEEFQNEKFDLDFFFKRLHEVVRQK